MPKPGKKPLPTKIKELRGGKNTYHRKQNKKEPQPETSDKVPKAPAYLSKVAQAEWRRMAKELHGMGLLTKVDIVALAAYCECFANWVDITVKLQRTGLYIKSPIKRDKSQMIDGKMVEGKILSGGNIVQSPLWAIKNRAELEMRKWMVEFGMTPSSRSNVQATEKKKNDPLAEFMARGGKPVRVK